MKVEINYFNKRVIVDSDQVDLLTQKEEAVLKLIDMDKRLNTNGGCLDVVKIRRLKVKIARLDKKIRQNIIFCYH